MDKDSFWLHKFRATFATEALSTLQSKRFGIPKMDIEKLRIHLGHAKDSNSIWAYLGAATSAEMAGLFKDEVFEEAA